MVRVHAKRTRIVQGSNNWNNNTSSLETRIVLRTTMITLPFKVEEDKLPIIPASNVLSPDKNPVPGNPIRAAIRTKHLAANGNLFRNNRPQAATMIARSRQCNLSLAQEVVKNTTRSQFPTGPAGTLGAAGSVDANIESTLGVRDSLCLLQVPGWRDGCGIGF